MDKELQYIQSLLEQGIPLTTEQERFWTQNQGKLFDPMNSDPLGTNTGADPTQGQVPAKKTTDFSSAQGYADYIASTGGNRNVAAADWDMTRTTSDYNTKGPSLKIGEFSSQEDYVEYQKALGGNPESAALAWKDYQDNEYSNMLQRREGAIENADKLDADAAKKAGVNQFPFISPTGADLKTDLYSLGASIAKPAGSKGKALGIVGAAGSAALEIARGITAGIGFEKRQDYINKWYKEQQQDNNYTSAPQYENTDSTGKDPKGKYGGLFADGGEARFDPAQPDGAPQQQAPQQTERTTQMQQLVAMMLQDGDEPQIIIEELVSRGVPQGQAVQVVQQVTEMLTRVPQQQMPVAQQQQPQAPEMKDGGVYGRKEGDRIRFKYGEKEYIGKIKSIDGDKLILE